MTRGDAVTLGLVFMVVALLSALVAFTNLTDGKGLMRECAALSFALFLASSLTNLIRAATAPAVGRRRAP